MRGYDYGRELDSQLRRCADVSHARRCGYTVRGGALAAQSAVRDAVLRVLHCRYGCFWLYAGAGVAGWLWLSSALPETRNKSLEDIAVVRSFYGLMMPAAAAQLTTAHL